MPKPKLKIIQVMGWCNLHGSCPKGRINKIICHNLKFTTNNWKSYTFTNQGLVTRIIGIHSYPCISKHRLWPCRSNCHPLISIHTGVDDVVKASLSFLMIYFKVRQSSTTTWTPINNVFIPINQSLMVERHKDPSNRT